MSHTLDTLRIVGAPGTSKLLAGELSRLVRRGYNDIRLARPKGAGIGVVVFPFDPRVALIAARYHRTASRILWDLYETPARRLEPLYDHILEATRNDVRPWAWDGISFSIRPRNLSAFPAGVMQVVGTVKNALIDGLEARGISAHVDMDSPDLAIAVREHDERVSVSIDLTGAMHERGYRTEAGEAPLRENLASALLMFARYDPRSDVVIDPMAGSGTIAIEAALAATAAPLRRAPLACTSWPAFRDVECPTGPLFADARARILANDIDASVVAIAKRNAVRAGVDDVISNKIGDFVRCSVDDVRDRVGSADHGLIISNPPYGERMGGDDLVHLYRDLGRWCRQFRGFRAAFVVANEDFESAIGLRVRSKKPMRNGPFKGYFYLFDC